MMRSKTNVLRSSVMKCSTTLLGPKLPYVGELTRLPQVIPKNNRPVAQNGENSESILSLPSGFPELR